MRIVIDVSPLSVPRTGIGNYVRGLVAGLLEVGGDRHEVVAFGPSGPRGRGRIREALAGSNPELRLPLLPRAQWWRTGWSRLGRPSVEAVVGPLDVFHFSDWMYPPQRGGLRVTTVHDLVPLRFPDLVERQTRRMHGPKYENATRTCDVLFANSRFTAGELVGLLDVPEERIEVAYPGVDPIFTPEGDRADLGSPYVLVVSTLEPRKNLPTLVDGFQLLRRHRPELTLALTGLSGWERRNLAAEGVRLLGYVPDDELARLYRGASAFAYSSQFEGFGIPVVEALACGVPAVVSSHASLDEASGDVAWRADPDEPEAFAEALEQALEAPAEKRERGIAHAAQFTWRALGEAVLAGYERALPDSSA
jgi:glycosyltransferase involved in cell wall biosynthesis